MSGIAAALLSELRRAGASVYISPEEDDPAAGVLIVSPPPRAVAWPTNVEDAIEVLYDELYAAVAAESDGKVH